MTQDTARTDAHAVESPLAVEATARPGLSLPALVAVVSAAAVPFFLVAVKLHGLNDPDSFWHILSGRQVWGERAVVTGDPFGHFATNAWVHIDWLSDLAMAGVDHVAGPAAVAWMYLALDIVLYVTVFATCRSRTSALASAGIAVLALLGTFGSLGQRPQTISFILLAVFVHVWLRVAEAPGRMPWWLVPVTYVWACLHGLWFLGPLVGATVVVGMALDRSAPWRGLAAMAAVPVASVVVAAFTPVGPRLLTSAFTVNAYAGLVSEWQTPDIRQPNVQAALLLVVMGAVGFAASRRRVPWPRVLLWVMALGWVLLYMRTVAVGAVIAALVAAAVAADVLPGPPARVGRRRDTRMVAAAAVVAIALAALLAPRVAAQPRGMPTALDDSLTRLPAGTVVLNDDTAGGWLLYAHPDLQPVLDTRTYLFQPQYIADYIQARQGAEGWRSFVERTGATSALLLTTDPLVERLESELGWSRVDDDGHFVLLVAPAS